MKLLLGALAALCLVTPVFADDACPGRSKAELLAQIAGDKITEIPVPGTVLDELVIDVDAVGIWQWALKSGCVIAKPMLLDHVAGAPKLQGSGLEIGA